MNTFTAIILLVLLYGLYLFDGYSSYLIENGKKDNKKE